MCRARLWFTKGTLHVHEEQGARRARHAEIYVTRFDGVRVPATDYHPVWLDSLADDVTIEGSGMNGVAQGAEAVRSIVSYIRTLYDSQEFNFAGPYGENGFLEKERGALGWCPPAPVGLEGAVGRLNRSVHLRASAPLDDGDDLAGCWVFDREPVVFVMGRPAEGRQLGCRCRGHRDFSFVLRSGGGGGAGSAAAEASANVVSHCCMSARSGSVSGVSSAASLLLSVAAAVSADMRSWPRAAPSSSRSWSIWYASRTAALLAATAGDHISL